MVNSYPPGLYAKTLYFRVLKSIWNQELKDFVISRMKATAHNIKPVIVIDDTTEKSKCYLINSAMTDFELQTGFEADLLCRRVDNTAHWQIERTKIQKGTKSKAEKEIICTLISKKYLKKQILTNSETIKLGNI